MFPLENIPYTHNRFFTDREDILERIHHDFLSQQIQEETRFQALTGSIGMGKTQIALVYVQRYASKYQVCFWFDATTNRSLYESTVSLAELLKLPEQDRADDQYLYRAIKRWLSNNDRWLLVLDNLTNMAYLDLFIPPRSHGHVLITTLRQTLELFTYPILVPPMDRKNCALFLLYRSGIIATPTAPFKEVDYGNALTIIDETDRVSLAIDQAGAYINETCCSLERFLASYRKCARNLLARRGRSGYTHQESIETAISLALDKVADALPAALTLLRLFAFLQRDAIPTDLLADGAVALDGPLRALASEDVASQAIFVLRQFSLIQHTASTNTFTINRIVQTIVREKIPKKVQRAWVQRVVRLIYTVFPSAAFETWSVCEKYLIQAKECARLIEEFCLVENDAAQLLLCLGSYRLQRAYYQEAEQYFNQALQICQALETLASTEHPGISYALNSLALLYHRRGHYQQAEDFYQDALELRENAAKPDQHAVAQTRNNLATLYQDQGKLQQAAKLFREAIAIDEQALGRDHPETALFISNLAFLYDEQGHHGLAEILHRRVYTIVSQNLPVGHPDIALSLNALGTNAVAQGNYQHAEARYRDAILQQEQNLGYEHSDTAESLHYLAQLYTYQAKYQEAEQLYQQVLAIYERKLGSGHPLTAVVLTNLGWLYHLMQQEDRAEDLLDRSLAIIDQIPGKNTLDTYSCISTIAKFLIDQQHYEDACPFSQRALQIYQDRYGPENQRTLEAQKQQRMLFKSINDRHGTPDYQDKHLMQEDVFLESE